MAAIWRPLAGRLCEDTPLLQPTSQGGVRLELTGRGRVWIVELIRADCEAIAEAIGRGPLGQWPGLPEE